MLGVDPSSILRLTASPSCGAFLLALPQRRPLSDPDRQDPQSAGTLRFYIYDRLPSHEKMPFVSSKDIQKARQIAK